MESIIQSDKLSPVTLQPHLQLIDAFETHEILDRHNEINLDVSSNFKELGKVYLFRCLDSGYRFYYPFSIFASSSFYSQIQAQNPHYYPKDKWEFSKAFTTLPNSGKLLEIGCGVGHFMQKAKRKGLECTGLELNPNAIHVARQNGLTVLNQDLKEHAIAHKEQYDVVCAFQVLEHITEVRSFVEHCLLCLKPRGILIFGVPNSNP
jgi:2-polyprenyl-3-methyl-5-hydroxy-6-metoxy-1,4-benzoquinol methylase